MHGRSFNAKTRGLIPAMLNTYRCGTQTPAQASIFASATSHFSMESARMISRSNFLAVQATQLFLALVATAALPTLAMAFQNWGYGPQPDYRNKLRQPPNYTVTTRANGASEDRFIKNGGLRDRSGGVRIGGFAGKPVIVHNVFGKTIKYPTVNGTAYQDSTKAMDRLNGNNW